MQASNTAIRLAYLVVATAVVESCLVACSQPPVEVDRRLAIGAEASVDAKGCLKLADPAPVAGYDPSIKGLMVKYCMPCHDDKRQPPFLTTYDQVKAAAAASKAAIARGSMPPPPKKLTQAEQDMFSAWIDAQMPAKDGVAVATAAGTTSGQVSGSTPAPATASSPTSVSSTSKLNNCTKPSSTPSPGPTTPATTAPTPPPGGPATTPPTTALSYAAVIAPYVTAKCASCHRPGGTPPVVNDYNSTKLTSARSLIRMKAQTMPLSGGNTPTEISNFEAWIQGGMQP